MTKLFKEAVEAISALPDERQDELARVLLQLAGVDQPPYQLTPEEQADLEASIAEAERGEFATDEEIRAIWAKHGRGGFAIPAEPLGSLKPSSITSRSVRRWERKGSWTGSRPL